MMYQFRMARVSLSKENYFLTNGTKEFFKILKCKVGKSLLDFLKFNSMN